MKGTQMGLEHETTTYLTYGRVYLAMFQKYFVE
jgi:hypothetical protein